MKTNPVYKREIMVSTRSIRLALVLLVFNGILALVALLNMYCLLYTSPSPRDGATSRMPSSA